LCTWCTGARGTDHPPFSNFLFTNLFSIKFLYFFIISSLFPYFNLFVSIFIQSYVNIKLHVSTLYRVLYILIIHKACNSAGLKIVPLHASSTFIAPYFHYVIQTTGARGTDLPPPPFFSNFLFTNLFSIKFLYFFIISSLFPYFDLFVSIFIQSYVNIKLQFDVNIRLYKY
jgi:hypothetical protein